ncbi:MAG TPA: sigma-70 family RNA polymerase sigma factor [Planctomycetota bacterium]|nr:sigma-70 family RNA polymerase sigma factor [Planctomycetota bacterium]
MTTSHAAMEPSPTNSDRSVDTYGADLFRLASAKLFRREDAEDAVQETLLAAIRAAQDFRGDSSERTWLFGILHHKIVDQIRAAERRERNESLDEDAAYFDDSGHWRNPPRGLSLPPGDGLLNREFMAQLRDCLRDLPRKQALAFISQTLEDQDSEATRKELGVTSTNLWVLLHRARLGLRACLENHWSKKGAPSR